MCFVKKTHSESYLHYFSYASEKIKLGIAQSLFLRALRICSPDFLDNEIEHVKTVLTNLAYPRKVLKQDLLKARKVHFSIRKKKLPKNKNYEVTFYKKFRKI